MNFPSKSDRPVAQLLEQLTHTADGVFAVDAHQHIILWNQAASSLLGYTSGEVLGRNCCDVIQGKDCAGNMVCQKHCFHIEQSKKFRWQSHQNFQTHSKSGKAVWIDVTTLSILSTRRKLAALVHTFRQTGPATAASDRPAGSEPFSPGKLLADRENSSASWFPLNERELAVLLLMAEGLTTKKIGSKLFISPVTVRNHIQNILKRLDVHSRLEAILWAIHRVV